MGHILHVSATTTQATRRAIQNSQESLRALSKRYGINQKTVSKWKKRPSTADLPDPRATRAIASQFLRNLVVAIPYQVDIVLTDNGIQFCHPRRYRDGPSATMMGHLFDRVCAENNIEHRLAKVTHPWTNGQVERMSRTIKEATVKRFHYDNHDQVRTHLADFINAYNFARRLKTLKGLTPYEFICKQWTSEPDRFKKNPIHQMTGLNT